MTNRRARAARRCGHTFRYPLAEGFLLGEMQDRRSVRTVKMRGPAGLSLAAAAAVPGRGRCRPEGGGARSRRWRGMEWPVQREDGPGAGNRPLGSRRKPYPRKQPMAGRYSQEAIWFRAGMFFMIQSGANGLLGPCQ